MGWLDGDTVRAALGEDLTDDTDAGALDMAAEAVAEWVQDQRPDLFVEGVFTPGAQVVYAASMVAWRIYRGRTMPAAEVAADPTLGAMLGVGRSRKFAVGGAAGLAPVVAP